MTSAAFLINDEGAQSLRDRGEFLSSLSDVDSLLSCCAAPNHPLRAYAITAAGSTTELELNTGKYSKLCTRARAAENLLTLAWKGVSLNIKKGNGGLCLCDRPTRINRIGSPGWISALPSWYLRVMKEDAAVVAISLLTLFVICLQALICFTDVARAPPLHSSYDRMSSHGRTAARMRAQRRQTCTQRASTLNSSLKIQNNREILNAEKTCC